MKYDLVLNDERVTPIDWGKELGHTHKVLYSTVIIQHEGFLTVATLFNKAPDHELQCWRKRRRRRILH